MVDLKGKIAIVTGASSGIGAAIVKALLELDMKVVGLARRKEKVEELGKGYEEKLFALKTDLTNEQDILNAFSWTQENVGPVYVVINNAGVVVLDGLVDAKTDDIKKVLDTNLLGVVLSTREAIKTMNSNKTDGLIININSVAGHYILPYTGGSIYQASKYGVTAFTESIRLELAKAGSKIRITSLSPGLVESEMSEPFLKIASLPYVKSEDIANGVKYILAQPPIVNIAELTIRPTAEVPLNDTSG